MLSVIHVSFLKMTNPIRFTLDGLNIGSSLFLIAGPCVIESEEHVIRMAQEISAVAKKLAIPYVFKASYDKANRTSLRSFRGPGLEEGLRILRKVKETVGVPVLTDVHEVVDVPQVADAADGSAGKSRTTRQGHQHKKRTICFPVGHEARG